MKTPGKATRDKGQDALGQDALDQVREIALGDLRLAPWNARKTFDPASMAEFTESVRARGVLVPLLVRPLSLGERQTVADAESAAQGDELYEIVAGHRRFTAAQTLNMIAVRCIVREMPDGEAREIGLTDNLQREDLPALEEADGFAELQARLGTAAAIAQRVGKDVTYVARRLRLVSLGELPRQALAERLITVDHALLLARLGADEQDDNLKWTLNTNAGAKASCESVIAERIELRESKNWIGYWEPQSVKELQHHIEKNVGRKLSRANWALDDAELLPEAGACSSCPSNTKANDVLFGDLAIDDATCEDGLCFERKRAAFVQIGLQNAALKNPPKTVADILRVSWKATTTAPRQLKDGGGVNPAQTFKDGQWREAKKGSCEHARAAVTVDWSDANNRGFMGDEGKLRKPGEILLACIEPKCKAHPKAYEEAAGQATGRGNENSERARKKAEAENRVRMGLVHEAIAKVEKLSGEVLRALALRLLPSYALGEADGVFPGIEKVLRTQKVESASFARAAAALLFIDAGDKVWAQQWSGANHGRAELLQVLRTIGWKGADPWAKDGAVKAAKPGVKKAAKKPAPAKKAAKKGGRK